MAQFKDDQKVLIIRKALGLNQAQLAKKLLVSPALISAIERGNKKLTDRVMDKFVGRLGVSRDWITDSEGNCFAEQTPKAEKLNEAVAITLEELGQKTNTAPSVAGIAIGISTGEVVKRLCQAYSAKNAKDLAINHLHISPTAISRWIKRNKIPDEQILKVIKDGKITPEQLLSNDEYILVKKYVLVGIIWDMYLGEAAKRPDSIIDIKLELERLLERHQPNIRTNDYN